MHTAFAVCIFLCLPAIAAEFLPNAEIERMALFSPDQQNSDLRGHLKPKHKTTLAAEMSAKVQRAYVSEGGRFKKGQVLFVFDCSVQNAELARANALLHAANERLLISRELVSLNSISQLEMANVQAELAQAVAVKDVWQAKVKRCRIYAPYTGRVVALHIRTYEYAQEGQALMDILDDRDLEIEVLVPSSWLTWLKKGHAFSVFISESSTNYNAVITQLGAKVDPVSQTLKITGEIQGKHPELLSGMSGKVSIKAIIDEK
ncbi:MAG: efflux RND transporter periplasmic adaptor subunit [Mariprofundaceae bacterium]|nr:efflux RND transporter periplasmic adaptor subunit [Mariprofundaceae bacterium]